MAEAGKGTVPDHSIRICADRGGTFCDLHASYPDPEDNSSRREFVVKLLSQDPSKYRDAPTEGIRRILERITGEKIERGTKLPTNKIDYIRLSTTVATNALLERKGKKHALLITKGFKDLLLIGNQSRPRIFDLNIKRPEPLYSDVVEVDERVTLVGYTSDPEAIEHAIQFDDHGKIVKEYSGEASATAYDGNPTPEIVRGLSGEAVQILQKPDLQQVERDLRRLYDQDFRSIAVIFAHSYTFPDHEIAVGRLAEKLGFTQVSLSSQLLPMIKMLPRGVSSTADAYLTPILRDYLDGFFAGFDEELRGSGKGAQQGRHARVEFMGSDGGLLNLDNFSGLKSILSGPAGGVVGYALTSWDEKSRKPIIGLDVGGTSTDVSRYAGRYEVTYETTTAGISIQSPQLDINTVAAGGGSCLTFRNGLFRAGPESSGAQPGPACYRKGGPLSLTDANLLLGRILPEYFPKIFGESETEPLDVEASREKFQALRADINAQSKSQLTLDEIVYGFIKVANETMCRPIRALTEAKGYSTGNHILATFGGAGGQHACEIARLLGIKDVLIHRYSSILSAYGLSLADRVYEIQEPSSTVYDESTRASLIKRLNEMEAKTTEVLRGQGFDENKIQAERFMNMRFDGTDTSVMILDPSDGSHDFAAAFKKQHKEEFGFLLEGKAIMVDDLKVRGLGKTFDTLGDTVHEELKTLDRREVDKAKQACTHSVYFDEVGRVDDTPVYELPSLSIGDVVQGPAMIIDDTQTIVVVPKATATVTTRHLVINLHS